MADAQPPRDDWRIRRWWWVELLPIALLVLVATVVSVVGYRRSGNLSELLILGIALVVLVLRFRGARKRRFRRNAPPDVLLERERFKAAKSSDGKRINRPGK